MDYYYTVTTLEVFIEGITSKQIKLTSSLMAITI